MIDRVREKLLGVSVPLMLGSRVFAFLSGVGEGGEEVSGMAEVKLSSKGRRGVGFTIVGPSDILLSRRVKARTV